MMKSAFGRSRVAAALVATMALGAYGLSTAASQGADETSVVIGARLVPETIDPAQASNVNNDFYVAAMYDRLVTFTAKGELAPAILASWKYSDDALTLTAKVRDDVTFHSGNKLTAKDVAYSLDRLVGIGGGAAGLITDYAGATVDSDTQLTIKLKRPNINFILALSTIYVVDSKLVAANEGSDRAQKWLSANDAGSGPYTLKTYNANQQVAYARMASHWTNIANRPDRLTVRIITEPSAIRDELRAGGVDLGLGIPALDIKSFESDDRYTVETMPSTRVTLVVMNMQGKVTSDPRVREAIQIAYDVKGHLKAAAGGYGEVATSLVPASIACRLVVEPLTPDLKKAKQLVTDAGAAGATLTLSYQPVIPEQRIGGTLIEAALRSIGFNVEVKPVTYPQYLAAVKTNETTPDVAIFWDIASYPAIGPMLTRTWASDRINVTNFARYSNPKVDSLLSEAALATDPKKSCDGFKQAQELIVKDRPAVIVAFPAVVHVFAKKIAEIPYTPVSNTFNISLLTLAK